MTDLIRRKCDAPTIVSSFSTLRSISLSSEFGLDRSRSKVSRPTVTSILPPPPVKSQSHADFASPPVGHCASAKSSACHPGRRAAPGFPQKSCLRIGRTPCLATIWSTCTTRAGSSTCSTECLSPTGVVVVDGPHGGLPPAGDDQRGQVFHGALFRNLVTLNAMLHARLPWQGCACAAHLPADAAGTRPGGWSARRVHLSGLASLLKTCSALAQLARACRFTRPWQQEGSPQRPTPSSLERCSTSTSNAGACPSRCRCSIGWSARMPFSGRRLLSVTRRGACEASSGFRARSTKDRLLPCP